MKKSLLITIAIVAAHLLAALFAYLAFFSAPQSSAEPERFVVTLDATRSDVANKLAKEGFIKSAGAFRLVSPVTIEPGGYRLDKSTNAFTVARALRADPYMKWVVIPEGLRKEEIAALMQEHLGWTDEQANTFLTKDTNASPDLREGVYFPDTYLIPVDEPTSDVAKRLNRRFNEAFEPYAKEAIAQNVKWTTVVNIASLVQREAAGKADMPLIAGVIWNRLEEGMKLDIDATVQYARGDAGKGWWAPLEFAKDSVDSPYNTYRHKGLPPGPIANPGLDAIRAVLHPEETECFYYLHDKTGDIYCSATYDEHKRNIEEHLTK